jgi:hypothetical protein
LVNAERTKKFPATCNRRPTPQVFYVKFTSPDPRLFVFSIPDVFHSNKNKGPCFPSVQPSRFNKQPTRSVLYAQPRLYGNNALLEPCMNTSQSRGSATSPPPINWATKPIRRPADSLNIPLNNVEEAGTAARPPPQFHIDTNRIGDLQEALRHLSGPGRRQPKVSDSFCQDELKSHAFELKFYNYSHLDGRDDLCLDGHDPSSEVDDLALAFSHLSTSTNSAPNYPIDPATAPVTPSTTNRGTAPLGYPLTARTVPATAAVVSYGRRKYYVIIVGKCAGIYHDMW